MVIQLTCLYLSIETSLKLFLYFRKATTENNIPKKVIIDKSGSNKAALDAINTELDQDHRFIKKQLKPMLNFKYFKASVTTIAGIESIGMIQKGQVVGAKTIFPLLRILLC